MGHHDTRRVAVCGLLLGLAPCIAAAPPRAAAPPVLREVDCRPLSDACVPVPAALPSLAWHHASMPWAEWPRVLGSRQVRATMISAEIALARARGGWLEALPSSPQRLEHGRVPAALGAADTIAVRLDGGLSSRRLVRDAASMRPWPGLRPVPLTFVARPVGVLAPKPARR